MKAKNVTLYSCDFCLKKLFREHAMKKHEEMCGSNPKNQKACYNCVHLNVEEIERYIGSDYDGDPQYTTTGCMKCEKLDKLMYSFSAERRGLPEKYPEDFEEQERMPNTCRHIEYGNNDFDFPW